MQNSLEILGSVSPFPIKGTSCPGYLLNIDNVKILLDCGSGTCGKLNIPTDFENLNIFISHFHKDHYSDLLSIAYASYVYNKLGILNEKINLYIPKVDISDSSYYDYKMLLEMKEHYFNIIEYDNKNNFNIEDTNISFFQTYHPVVTYSICIEKNDFKFVYGADMGYQESFCEFAKNSDILLLESSFIDEKEKNTNYHLTSKDAAMLAKISESKKLILTHFWPFTEKEKYLNEANKIFNNTIVAEDDLIVKF